MVLATCSDQRIDCPPVVDTTEIVATNSTLGTQYFELVGFYEYGVEFDQKVVKNPTGDVAKDLLRIENFLTRQAALTARLSEQKIA